MRQAVICVPARDEGAEMPRLLRALAAQDSDGPVRVLLLANQCHDGTAAMARDLAQDHPRLELRVREVEFPPAEAHAGSARRAALQAGAEWLCALGAAREGVLLTTDADATPPPDWLAANLRALAAGADVVGGRIEPEDSTSRPLDPALRRMAGRIGAYWHAVRALSDHIDPVDHDRPPRHGDHTGGSLAVTLPWLEAVGGVPALRSREDVAFVDALERAGARLRHAPDVWVTVSARQLGRAEGGMAAEMRRWAAASFTEYRLPAASHWLAVASRRRQVRDGFRAGVLPSLAASLGLEPAVLERVAADSPNDIACVARLCALLPDGPAVEQEIGAATRDMLALAATDDAA